MAVSVITWNVNSIRARLNHCLELLEEQEPDFLLLQEMKATEIQIPNELKNHEKYNLYHCLEPRYNGVAILTKHEAESQEKKIEGENVLNHLEKYKKQDYEVLKYGQARFLEITTVINGKDYKIASLYCPNGGVCSRQAGLGLDTNETERYSYKMAFFADLEEKLSSYSKNGVNFIYAGDYNIAPSDDDVHDPRAWEGSICFTTGEKNYMNNLLANNEIYDAFRVLNPNEANAFTWWDYRRGNYQRNLGIRIDYHLINKELKDKVLEAKVLTEYRQKERPSDHAPVLAVFSI